MGLLERQARRQRRREEREKRRQQLREAPDLISLPENRDPLLMYDVYGANIGHAVRDLWRGKSAFLVGAGPSLNTVDYTRLSERGICSLGINNSAAYVPTTAMTFADPPEKFHFGVFFDPCVLKFVPLPKINKRVRAKVGSEFKFTAYSVAHCPSVFGFKRIGWFEPTSFFTEDGASWGTCAAGVKRNGRPKCIFTFFIGLRLLHYLGVRRVYLLGVDFAMQPGAVLGNYAFKETGVGEGNNEHYRVAAGMCEELVPVFRDAGFQVLQTNPTSRLTCFPYVSFDQALEDCRSPVPQEPFDLTGWYRMKGTGRFEDSSNRK